MYLKGEGVASKDNEKALEWFQKSSSCSNLEAKFILGQMYKAGCGCIPDNGAAFRYLESAAKKGHKGAQILLGNMYLKGEGVRASKSDAEDWFAIADGKKPLSSKV